MNLRQSTTKKRDTFGRSHRKVRPNQILQDMLILNFPVETEETHIGLGASTMRTCTPRYLQSDRRLTQALKEVTRVMWLLSQMVNATQLSLKAEKHWESGYLTYSRVNLDKKKKTDHKIGTVSSRYTGGRQRNHTNNEWRRPEEKVKDKRRCGWPGQVVYPG